MGINLSTIKNISYEYNTPMKAIKKETDNKISELEESKTYNDKVGQVVQSDKDKELHRLNHKIVKAKDDLNISDDISKNDKKHVFTRKEIDRLRQLGILSGKKEEMENILNAIDDKHLKKVGIVECSTCASRQYQDGSDDHGVSFKSATHLSPVNAGAAVMSHEMEHVVGETSKAREEGKQVINQSVQLETSTCAECGRNYISGGVTKTTTASKAEASLQQEKKERLDEYL